MNISYFDDQRLTDKTLNIKIAKLSNYRLSIKKSTDENNTEIPEYSLYYPKDWALHETITKLRHEYKGIKHLVLVGIGGSNLGTEAVHSVLDNGKIELSVLDTISAHALSVVLEKTK